MGPPPTSWASARVLTFCLSLFAANFLPDAEAAGGRSQSQGAQAPADFDCPEEFGYYAHPSDCTLYYVCVFGGALLESCTGGLMYSHELQTCDWPRNVGCAPGQQQVVSQPQQQHITQKLTQQPVQQTVDLSSSRGRQRQQQHQIQIPKADLYTEEEDLGPAEELESDRQQRVYRGQPSTLGQVASDRDGLSTHTNAIPVPSTGGRDKLSVVSYGAQQQYNSKNRRRQTDGVDNSDHNFLTNISRVRKKRDSNNSNRRSPQTPTQRGKNRSRRLQRQDAGRRVSNKGKNSATTKTVSSIKTSEEKDKQQESSSDQEGLSSSKKKHNKRNSEEYQETNDKIRRYDRSHEDEYSYDERRHPSSSKESDDEQESYDEDEENDEDNEDDENGEESTGESNNEKDKDDKDKSTSKESNTSDEFEFDDGSNEGNFTSEDFKMEFPKPPSGWDSFEDFKFPYDDFDFDFDKFLEEIKNDTFDYYDINDKNKSKSKSSTAYPTSIFNFEGSTFPPLTETSTIPPGIRFSFYFPHFKNNTIQEYSEKNPFDAEYNFSEENKNTFLSQLTSDHPWESTKLPTSTAEPLIAKGIYSRSHVPHIISSSNQENPIFPERIQEAEDRIGKIEPENRRSQFDHAKHQHFTLKTQIPAQLNRSIADIFKNKWLTSGGLSGLQNLNNGRGSAKFTFLKIPVPSTTPLTTIKSVQKAGGNIQYKATSSSPGAIGRVTTEKINIAQVTPNTQSTNSLIFGGKNDQKLTYSRNQGNKFEPFKIIRNGKLETLEFTTAMPGANLDNSEFMRRSSESLRNPALTPAFSTVSGNQRIVSYSYPSATFQESRGLPSQGNPQILDRQHGKPVYAIPVPQVIRQNKGNFLHSSQKPPSSIIHGSLRPPGRLSNPKPTPPGSSRSRFPPSQQRGQTPNNFQSNQQSQHIFRAGSRFVNDNHQNSFQREKNRPINTRQPFRDNKQGIRGINGVLNPNRDILKEKTNHNQDVRSSQEKNTPLSDKGIGKSRYTVPFRNQGNNLSSNSAVSIKDGKNTFSYVNIHDNEQIRTDKIPVSQEEALNSTLKLIGGFQPSSSWESSIESTPKYKLDSNEKESGSTPEAVDTSFQKNPNDTEKSHPPAGSYVFFTSNTGSTVAVPVQENNVYKNHKESSDDDENDYYEEYDEGDYSVTIKNKTAVPKRPPVPKTLQNINYQDYNDPGYDEYSGDDTEYEDEAYEEEGDKKNEERNVNDEEYYEDEENEEEDREEPKREQSVERPQAIIGSATTTKEVGCIPLGVTPLPGKEANICPSEKTTDRPTTTPDEQNNSEQTRRTITLLRASVQPIQQQAYDPRGYNNSRYIQQQQYDPNYYSVYDEEAEQYKDIADYAAQYVQQKQQDTYTRKKPSVEIIQQEQIQRASPYPKTKYSNQQENIYQSVTPQEYDSYSIQTNDDIPYRQVQTKSNNRYPEVKESGPTQGERRLITLSAKFSHEGTVQTNSQTNTDRDNGRLSSGSEASSESNIVNITPRKDNRFAGSSELPIPSRRNNGPAFAQEINSLAQSGALDDPVAKVLQVLTKSEEYSSDEASTERSSENRSGENRSGETSKENSKSLTVEEVDIDFLKRLNGQNSNSGSFNRFRFTPRSEEKYTTEPSIISHYRIGESQLQSSPTPKTDSFSLEEPGSRQAKVLNEEVTTPKPLILQFQDTYERGIQQTRRKPESTNIEVNGRNDALNARARGGIRHHSSEMQSNQRHTIDYAIENQRRWPVQQSNRENTRNSGYLIRQENTESSEPQRKIEQSPVHIEQSPTPSPLRITVAPLPNDNLKEQLLRQYNSNIENNKKIIDEGESLKPSLTQKIDETSRGRQTVLRSFDSSQESEEHKKIADNINPEKQTVNRIQENNSNSKPNQRQRLMPLSDFVNSNVNTMIQTSRNLRPVSIEDDKSVEDIKSVEEQASEEARKPIAIRIPESYTQKSSEENKRNFESRQRGNQNDYSRNPIRYIDSLEYKQRRRGSSKFKSSGSDEYENSDLINVTEEPLKPISIRIPQRIDPSAFQSKEQGGSHSDHSNTDLASRSQASLTSRQEPKSYQPVERKRIVSPPELASHEDRSEENVKPQVAKPIAIRVPESIDLNQYQNRDQGTAAKVADSLSPIRTRGRVDEENRQTNDYRTRSRVPSSSEEPKSDEQLRNRYEAATTLRPNRVLNIPTISKPTRPPKKFRNGTQYSDLTLPIGTDQTFTDQPEPDPSIRARPMSYNVPSSPGLTRGNSRHRGSISYTISPNEAEPVTQQRGTPPPQRGRPTLKPSTTVVGKASEYQDIYRYPATRPENVYPTPQVDKTAAKCRKDVCLLPDCYCGGKDIPGDLTPEETPQIVLLTFDDSVNDLNKGLYSDLFEKGRVNPNGCPISATFYVSHEWTDYSQVQNLYAGGHEIASHSVSHSFGEQFSQRKWTREIAGQREILAAYGGVKLEDIRGMRAPFLAVGGNKMFKMLYDSNFTYDSSMPVYENRPPSWPYTLDYKIFHDCMIPPCPTKSYPGVWEVPMVMWQDLNGGRCSMGDACSNPPNAEGVYKMLIKNFERHFTSNRSPFGLFYHAAWFTQPHHKEGFIAFLDTINKMPEVWLLTNWQAIQWVRDPTPLSRLGNFAPFQCNYPDRPKKCNNPKVCNLWHKSGVRYMRTCQACPEIYPWTGKSGVRNSRVDNDLD